MRNNASQPPGERERGRGREEGRKGGREGGRGREGERGNITSSGLLLPLAISEIGRAEVLVANTQ